MPCMCKFTQKDVLKLIPRLKARTLMSWSEFGWIKATHQEAVGHRGTFRVYSAEDVVKIGMMFALKQIGIKQKYINQIVNGDGIENP